ncbi:hypothetical protein F7Q99_39125 [Streptomyces kaniharaensis]|uniref:Uncharacterized protein n=1 Tax=Streptomyces kaniharaensis TaxID=212423 RepID=A0A6N7L425_9ACTN|nr:hypothetical protein [Streptomyces kaniharaensis]MQS18008.1 hypothetical protein [Streptomyces kaniharaensis]MQS18045.1 hypothetical protein [Streptomyces kaniharaensis]
MVSNGWSRVHVPVPPAVAPYTVPGGAGVPPMPSAPPAVPLPTGVPEVVIRSRAELEQLRDDARQELAATEESFRAMWLDPRHRGEGLTGVLNAVLWLLGERPLAPMSNEVEDSPLPVTRSIGREQIHAEDRVFGRAWREERTEWYAGGVLRTLEWSHIQGRDRPISESF